MATSFRFLALVLAAASFVACGDDSSSDTSGGNSGSGGSGATGGSAAGTSGSGGSNAGSAGNSGSSGTAGSTAGSAGDAGSGGIAGSGNAGSGGSGGSAGSGNAGAGGSAGSTAGTSGSAGTGNAGAGGSTGATAGTAGTGGTGGSIPVGPCETQADYFGATIQDVNNPAGTFGDMADVDGQGNGAFVRLTVRATTPKILVSKSNSSGTCLWGFFAIQTSGVPEEYSSIQVVGKGADAVADPMNPGQTLCPIEDGSTAMSDVPVGAGWIANDLKPGDDVTIAGFVSEFPFSPLNDSCMPAPSAAAQRQIRMPDDGCFFKEGTSGTFEHKVITTTAEMDALADITNATDQRKWGGTPIRIEGNFTAYQNPATMYNAPTDAMSKYGDIYLNETDLYVTNDVSFKSILSGVDNTYAYDVSTQFTAFQGIYFLDFCKWVLATTVKCGDVEPAEMTCPLSTNSVIGCRRDSMYAGTQ